MSNSVLQRVAAGDATAIEECLSGYGGLVWSLARRLSPTEADAEDAAQDIFVEIWKKASRYDPREGSEAAFITVIARRRLIDRHRKRTRSPETASMGDEALTIPDSLQDCPAEFDEQAARAKACLAQLRDEERQVLELSIYNGLSQRRIAERIGIPLGTVKTHARRGLLRLRELMRSAAPAALEGGAS